MKLTVTTCAAALLFLLSGCAAPSNPTPAAEPLAESPAPTIDIDHGAEAARLVHGRDEIVSVLENGMVVIARRVPSPVLTVRAYVRAGGIHEGEWLGGGISHVLEHLVAGGTTARRTEAENRELLQQIGNISNAYTTLDHTGYFVNTTPDNLENAVDLVADWVLGAQITQAEFERELEVVQRELERALGDPNWVFYHLTTRNRYQVSPARVPVIGYMDVIQRLTREDVVAYFRKAYQPNNMLFAVAGDLDPELMLATVRRHVGHAPAGRVFSHDIADEPPVLAPRTLVGTFPQLGQAHLQLAFPSFRLSHPDLYALDLLSAILTHGESALLVQEIRDRQGLVNSISGWNWTPEYVDGSFVIRMQLDPRQIAAATEAVLEQLRGVASEGVSQERLERARTQVRTSRAFQQQTAESVVESMAMDWLSTGSVDFSERYVERMQEVTAQQVQAAAQRWLDEQCLLITALVPEGDDADAPALARAVDLLRGVGPAEQERPVELASEIQRVELGDGTVLLLRRLSTSPVVTMTAFAVGGVTAEDADTHGLGNLAMQVVPRGTQERSARDIAGFFDGIGGRFSTASGNNTWNWSVSVLRDDFADAFEALVDLMKKPTFPDEEVEAMRRRILAQIQAQEAHWFSQAMRFFRQEYFGPLDSPYQFMPVGRRETVAGFTPEQVRQFYQDQILTSRRVIAIFGDIDLPEAQRLAEQHFGAAVVRQPQAQREAADLAVTPAPRERGVRGHIEVRDVAINPTTNPQAGVFIGFDAGSFVGDPGNYPLTVANTMASGFRYPTGYLFETLRGEGLVYDVQAFAFPGRSPQHPGAFVVYAGCDPRDVDRVVELILENIARLQGEPEDLQPQWFARSKQLITAAHAQENETASEQATTAALDELFGLGYDYSREFADRIRGVELSQVQEAARGRLWRCLVTVSTNQPEAVTVRAGVRTYRSFAPVDLTPRGVQHAEPGQ